MNPIILQMCQVLLLSSIICSLIRMIKGTTTMDRVLSFDAFAVSVVGLMILFYIQWKSALYLDLIIIFSLFGFFGTVAFSYFLHRTYPFNEKGDTHD